jgi:hypothetical protein
MKTELPRQTPKRVDKPTAWACTLANLAAVPGLGTVAAGRRIGYVQAAIALVGFALSFLGLGSFLREWRALGEYPEGFRPSLYVALVGVGLYGTAWLWAFRTSVRLHEAAKSARTAPEAPPRLLNPTGGVAAPPILPPSSPARPPDS